MAKLRVLISNTYNPWFNIATEDWIFRELDPSYMTLYLWRNQETVVIGRSQNPWAECNLTKMEQDKVYLARRSSGGGAVFQDLGNTCFTFLTPKSEYNRAINSGIIIKALEKFGVQSEASGRNDIVVPMPDGPRKISGAAFRETHDRALHHGTLLINANLEKLANYLTPNPKKLQSKGRASVRARVMNLSEINPQITHETLTAAIIEEFFKQHQGECEIENLDAGSLAQLEGLKTRYEMQSSWDWNYGHSPNFEIKFEEYLSWGFVEIHINSEQAKISKVKIFSDSLFPELVENLENKMFGKAFTKTGILQATQETIEVLPQHQDLLLELSNWLVPQIEV